MQEKSATFFRAFLCIFGLDECVSELIWHQNFLIIRLYSPTDTCYEHGQTSVPTICKWE